jgi:hypothetical protein
MAVAMQPVTSLSSAVPAISTHTSSIRNSRAMTAKPNRILNTKFVVDWNNPSTLTSLNKTKTNAENLQEAFRRFREQRIVCLKKFHRRMSVLRPSLPDSISNSRFSN